MLKLLAASSLFAGVALLTQLLAFATPVPQPKPKQTEFRFLGVTPDGCAIILMNGRRYLQCPRRIPTPGPAVKTTTI